MSPSDAHADAIRPLALRGLTLASNLVMAPLAGVSNLPFRLIAREAGAALAFTETVSAKGLVNGGRKTWSLLETSPREAGSARLCAPPRAAAAIRAMRGGFPGILSVKMRAGWDAQSQNAPELAR